MGMVKYTMATVAGLATALTLTGAAALPAHAGQQTAVSPATYSALGDSFAAGFGAGQPVTPLGQSAQAYPVLLARGLGNLTFLAVPFGATSATLAGQIQAVPSTTRQVTLTAGGNDFGFVERVTTCFSLPAACQPTSADRTALRALTASLAANLEAIHQKAPAARIYVTGYPLLFQAAQTRTDTGLCVVGDVTDTATGQRQPLVISERQADGMDASARALNRAIKSAVIRGAHRYATFVDVRPAFAGHGLCGTPTPSSQRPNPASYLNEVHLAVTQGVPQLVPANGPLHPNASGQQAYASRIVAKGFKR